MMSDPISRQLLEEAFASVVIVSAGDFDMKGHVGVVEQAVQAILDGERIAWCLVHHSEQKNADECDKSLTLSEYGKTPDPCQPESQIRVRVRGEVS